MLWRIWAFLSGLPVGGAIALAALRDPAPLQLVWGALAGGAALALLVTLLARRHDDEFERGRHLAAASGFAWAAAPAAVAIFFDWSPGPWIYVGLVAAVLAVALFRGSRSLGPAGGLLRWKLRAAAVLAVASAGVLALAATAAALRSRAPAPNARFSSALYAIDAEVATRPLPICNGEVRGATVLQERGAHPSLSPDGRQLWFDAAVPRDGGRRQVHRMDRATGAVTCTTCGQAGNNAQPSVSPNGASIVFASDRHATWRRPDDTDLYLAPATGAAGDAGQRLSFAAGPDESPVFGPGPMMVTWSRRSEGRYAVVTAALRSGHGGLLLGAPLEIAAGGAQWIAPLAWSPDGRSLLVARGNPYAPLAVEAVDPTTLAGELLATDAAPAGAFDGDGGWLAFATSRPLHRAGLLPRVLGFALAPFATAPRAGVRRGDTGVRSGASAQAARAAALDLPAEVAGWGEPTGIALEPDGGGVVIGQRRDDEAGGARERIVALQLDCAKPVAVKP